MYIVKLFFVIILLVLGVQDFIYAQSFPIKPVKIIVPFSPGGPPDTIARFIAQKLYEKWGQQVYVENIPGASGNIGYQRVIKATPDGYTLGSLSPGFMINPSLFTKKPFDPLTDFTLITLIAGSPNLLAVHPSFPVSNMLDLVAHVKKSQGVFSYAHPSNGTIPHLLGEQLKLKENLDIITAAYPGAGPAILSTIGGHTPIVFVAVPGAAEFVKSGKLKAIAVTSLIRSAALPNVPTMHESGFRYMDGETLSGLIGPSGIPVEIVNKINLDVYNILQQNSTKEELLRIGFDVIGFGPEKFRDKVKTEVDKWATIIDLAKIPKLD